MSDAFHIRDILGVSVLHPSQPVIVHDWQMFQGAGLATMGVAPTTPPECAYCGSQFVLGRISCGCGANRPRTVPR